MGARSGSGGGGSHGSYRGTQIGGFTQAPFPGAAKISDLKVGDKIKGEDGTIFSVSKIEKINSKHLFITTSSGEYSHGNAVIKNGYLKGTKVNPRQ